MVPVKVAVRAGTVGTGMALGAVGGTGAGLGAGIIELLTGCRKQI